MFNTVQMGCFGYNCACGGDTCGNVGTQQYGDVVVIEVPLKDGTTVFLEGNYTGYGSVEVDDYEFYLDGFRDHFKGWLNGMSATELSKKFLAKRIWTIEEDYYPGEIDYYYVRKPARIYRNCFDHSEGEISDFSLTMLDKFVRADAGLKIKTNVEIEREKLNDLKKKSAELEKTVKELEEKLAATKVAYP